MIFAVPLLVLALQASAAVLPRQTPCIFVMNAVGAPNGTIKEDTIGENRIGGTYPQGSYIITAYTLTDAVGHNCLIYPNTLQFECAQGMSGTTNFSLADNGDLLHDGSANWLACPATGPGDDGSYNIFSDQKYDTAGCETVTLVTGGFSCAVLGRPSSSSSAATALPTLAATSSAWSSTTPAPSTTTPSCPTGISSGVYQFPHLIVPTSPQAPNYAFGNSYTAHISPTNTTLYNFDIPSSPPYLETCALLFLFPFASSLDPSTGIYYFSGLEEEEGEHGGLDFALLAEAANAGTTYDTTGDVASDYGAVEIMPGNDYSVATFWCQSGQTVTFEVASKGNVKLDYFQDSAPSPIGLYVVPCA